MDALIAELRAIYGDAPTNHDLEAMATQVARLREARWRVDEEGAIIADPKGNAIPHPALAIERAAQAELRQWSMRFEPQWMPGPYDDK